MFHSSSFSSLLLPLPALRRLLPQCSSFLSSSTPRKICVLNSLNDAVLARSIIKDQPFAFAFAGDRRRPLFPLADRIFLKCFHSNSNDGCFSHGDLFAEAERLEKNNQLKEAAEKFRKAAEEAKCQSDKGSAAASLLRSAVCLDMLQKMSIFQSGGSLQKMFSEAADELPFEWASEIESCASQALSLGLSPVEAQQATNLLIDMAMARGDVEAFQKLRNQETDLQSDPLIQIEFFEKMLLHGDQEMLEKTTEKILQLLKEVSPGKRFQLMQKSVLQAIINWIIAGEGQKAKPLIRSCFDLLKESPEDLVVFALTVGSRKMHISAPEEQIFSAIDLLLLDPSADCGLWEFETAYSFSKELLARDLHRGVLLNLAISYRITGQFEVAAHVIDEIHHWTQSTGEPSYLVPLLRAHLLYYQTPLDDTGDSSLCILRLFEDAVESIRSTSAEKLPDAQKLVLEFFVMGFISQINGDERLADSKAFIKAMMRRADLALESPHPDDFWRIPKFLACWHFERGEHEAALAHWGEVLQRVKDSLLLHSKKMKQLTQAVKDEQTGQMFVMGPFPAMCQGILKSCTALNYSVYQQQMFVTRAITLLGRYQTLFPGCMDLCNKVIGHHLRELEIKSATNADPFLDKDPEK